jgi:nucleotide-binding universal stress UspA family protein
VRRWYLKALIDMASTQTETHGATGPVLLAYGGSELGALVIERAARELAPGRDALVVCVWQPVDVGFVPTNPRHFDADVAPEVRKAAEETAGYGASLAERAGLRAQALAVEAAPTWKGIVETAAAQHSGLIVVGAHRRTGLVGHLLGSVAAAVLAHAACSVLIVHQDP